MSSLYFKIKYLFKSFCRSCMICCKHNSQGNLRPKRGKFPRPSHPFQVIYMDFIELSNCNNYKYCLVIVCPFSKWVEIVPTREADAISVAKAICKNIIWDMGFLRPFIVIMVHIL